MIALVAVPVTLLLMMDAMVVPQVPLQTAVAATPGPDPTSKPDPATSSQARQEAKAAAKKVTELTREYRRRERVAAQAATELTDAFQAAAAADDAVVQAEAAMRDARARASALVRALYLDGDGGLALSALGASSPSEAVWRATVGRRIGAGLVRDGESEVARLAAVRDVALGRRAEAALTGERLSAALARFSEESEAAERLLDQARRTLAELSEQVRRLAAAERAAAELAAAEQAAAAMRLSVQGTTTALAIPDEFLRSYRASAGRCPGLRWTLLAAVGQVESGHGRNNGPSSAGALGPMQFMPATFDRYGVDGDGDGRAEISDPADAIASAANYLCASGLDGTDAGVRRALFAYNRANWYVDLVLRTERAVVERAAAQSAGGTGGGGA